MSVRLYAKDAKKLLHASLIGEQEIEKAISKKFISTDTLFERIKKSVTNICT